jgi:hypothetical protein
VRLSSSRPREKHRGKRCLLRGDQGYSGALLMAGGGDWNSGCRGSTAGRSTRRSPAGRSSGSPRVEDLRRRGVADLLRRGGAADLLRKGGAPGDLRREGALLHWAAARHGRKCSKGRRRRRSRGAAEASGRRWWEDHRSRVRSGLGRCREVAVGRGGGE